MPSATERAIKASHAYPGEWVATEEDWDLGDPIGYGKTEESAVENLCELIADREERLAKTEVSQ